MKRDEMKWHRGGGGRRWRPTDTPLKFASIPLAGVSGAFGRNSAVTLANAAGAFPDITGFNTQIGTLSGGGATGGTVTLGSATLTVNETASTSYSGAITGTDGTAGILLKTGPGALSLNGVQTYDTLTIDAGLGTWARRGADAARARVAELEAGGWGSGVLRVRWGVAPVRKRFPLARVCG